MSTGSPLVPEELESALCQINEVKAARVIVEEDKSIDEIHILASPEKSPKQLVRDVESLLKAEFA
ncbi:MAG: hypothetical protein ACE5E0_02205, partial [Terriglobia bacterium]